MASAAEKTGRVLLVMAALLALGLLAANAASAGPTLTRLVYAPGEIVPIPASIPHEEGDMVDKRIVGDLRWIAARYPIYVTDGYSGPLPNGEHVGCNMCHVKNSDHYNGLAVDLVPLNGTMGKCDASWAPCTFDGTMRCVTVTLTYNYQSYPLVPPVPLLDVALPAQLTSSAMVQLNPGYVL